MSKRRTAARRAAGLLWVGVWAALLWAVAAPWRHLGGLVDEHLRWLEWWVLSAGLAVGFTVGRIGRIVAERRGRFTHLSVVRGFVIPMAALAAAVLVVLTVLDRRDPIGVVVTALVAYWAGADLAFAAVPLIDGKPYVPKFLPRRSIAQGADEWVPPWERF